MGRSRLIETEYAYEIHYDRNGYHYSENFYCERGNWYVETYVAKWERPTEQSLEAYLEDKDTQE